jgi:YbbR domain-containing protein
MMRRLANNLQWKLLSLMLAVGLWLAVVREPELVTSQSVPIFFKNLPKELETGAEAPDRVHVEIRGPAGKLTPASLADTAVLIDLSAVESPGERTFTVSEPSLNLPSGVAFIRAVPSQLRLRFERVLSKEVPVQMRMAAPPPAGYRIAQQELNPGRLKIAGPENRVRLIEAAQTDPIDLSGVLGRTEFRVQAYVTDAQVRFEGASMVTVRVSVEKINSGR